MEKKECWSKLLFSPLGHLPDPGIEPTFLTSPASVRRFFTTSITWEVPERYLLSPYSTVYVCVFILLFNRHKCVRQHTSSWRNKVVCYHL